LVAFSAAIPVREEQGAVRDGVFVEDSSQDVLEERDVVRNGEVTRLEKQRTAKKDREVRTLKRKTLPKISLVNIVTNNKVERSRLPSAKIVREVAGVDEIRKMTVKNPSKAQCYSARTPDVWESLFSCDEGVMLVDDKETPLYTGRGKDYAFVDTTFDVNQDSSNHVLRLVHSAEFPRQQSFSVYYFDDDRWKLLCSNLKANRDASVSLCDASSVARGKDDLRIRVESYAREGTSIWSVNSLNMVNIGNAPVENFPFEPRDPNGDDGNDSPLVKSRDFEIKDEEGDDGAKKPREEPHSDEGNYVDGDDDEGDGDTPPGDVSNGNIILPTLNTIGSAPANVLNSDLFNPSEGEITPEVLGEEGVTLTDEPLGITGAAVAQFLNENKAGLGLLLLGVVVSGFFIIRTQRRKRYF